jgi:hypothetical protein
VNREVRNCYSVDDSAYCFFDESEVITECLNIAYELSELSVGVRLSYWVADAFDRKGSEVFSTKDLDILHERWDDRLSDMVGDDEDVNSCVPSAASQELEWFLRYWLDKHLSIEFLGICNRREKELVVTEEMVSQY